DATNVIERPAATVLTPVGIDHMDFLGDTLAAIAAEKAGIIKPGVPVVSAMQKPDVETVFERQAAKLRAPLHVAGQQWNVHAEHGRLVFQDEHGLLDL